MLLFYILIYIQIFKSNLITELASSYLIYFLLAAIQY